MLLPLDACNSSSYNAIKRSKPRRYLYSVNIHPTPTVQCTVYTCKNTPDSQAVPRAPHPRMTDRRDHAISPSPIATRASARTTSYVSHRDREWLKPRNYKLAAKPHPDSSSQRACRTRSCDNRSGPGPDRASASCRPMRGRLPRVRCTQTPASIHRRSPNHVQRLRTTHNAWSTGSEDPRDQVPWSLTT